ncbi:beta-galactosidase [Microbacterium halimionae]|uniref:Beta-galactosidase n=1 Tax=Microbacterium halimionae TaxID=1526413 RepID=A0A7W3PMK3_9MICO|nr:beta-galactosidase [Microbacterium halimionae]MBA8817166.1 beta-galactosidase [Microbacterium halimionae]NII94616.1 beta-galactosidase [Microbacterium halimionae]
MNTGLSEGAPTRNSLRGVVSGIAFGGDYCPEQWPRSVWEEDIDLMREARVNLVTVGVFSWGELELEDDVWEFGWLDSILGRLHEAGIAVDLATPTASPPIWLHQAHPEILPMDERGTRFHQGGRLQWCPSSPIWRVYATRVARRLAERYASHPAVRMWHVSNEIGGGNRRCYCPESTVHFQRWLAERYGSVAALNETWGTAFWGHRYGSFGQVEVPLDSESGHNPGLLLDFDRFSSDALLDHYRAERDTLRAAGVSAPITTNLMIKPDPAVADYASWAPEVDVIANDHYTVSSDARREQELSFCADRTRGLSKGEPWLLMEHSTGAVNWQVRNRSKGPGEMMRNSIQHIARGADGALFFQWRASRAGGEQFHSGMVPHAGTRTRIWQDVVQLGHALSAIAEVAETRVEPADVAIIVDDVAGWAWQAGGKPLNGFAPWAQGPRWHGLLGQWGIRAEVLPRTAALDDYRLIIIPGVYLVDETLAARIAAAASRGAVVVVTATSGIVDEANAVLLGGYPGRFRELLGVVVEEFFILQDGEEVSLDDGGAAVDWTSSVLIEDAETIVSYADGTLRGRPALTRRAVGEGAAWFVSAEPNEKTLATIVARVVDDSGVEPPFAVVENLECVRRIGADASYLFVINHGAEPAELVVTGRELIAGIDVGPALTITPGGVAVVRERRRSVGFTAFEPPTIQPAEEHGRSVRPRDR